MPIDPLGPASSLIAALRAEITRKGERGGRRAQARAAPTQDSASTRGARDPAALRRELAELVRDVPAADAQALDAVRPRVVRAVLLWEFGAAMREYGEWQPMLEQIDRTLAADPRHREEFARLVRDLQRTTG